MPPCLTAPEKHVLLVNPGGFTVNRDHSYTKSKETRMITYTLADILMGI